MDSILIVDDDLVSLNLMQQTVQAMGYQTHSCSHPKEALVWLKENSCSMLITDYQMPELNGIELMTMAREIRPDLVAILVTAYSNTDIISEALKQGAFDFVEKPLKPNYVREVIQLGMAFKDVAVDVSPTVTKGHFAKFSEDSKQNLTATKGEWALIDHEYISELLMTLDKAHFLELVNDAKNSIQDQLNELKDGQCDDSRTKAILHKIVGTASSLGLKKMSVEASTNHQISLSERRRLVPNEIASLEEIFLESLDELLAF
ncbi:MAG: response regulator [Bdellovibrionales bacterium]|nr:response regulator [Bdellovibrionales bacterium]